MANPKDGGPAFPVVERCSCCEGRGVNNDGMCRECDGIGHLHEGGMSLRDWFAGRAIQGLLAARAGLEPETCKLEPNLAEIAWHQADEMLVERSKDGAD